MLIEFSNRQSKFAVKDWYSLIRQALAAAKTIVQKDSGLDLAERASVFIMLAGPRIMRRINREQRQLDQLTDVLSFPQLSFQDGRLLTQLAAQDFAFDSRGQRILPLGDILICPAVAASQAAEYGHSLERELAFLAVHGFFHLLGYDHTATDSPDAILQLQEETLQLLGLPRR